MMNKLNPLERLQGWYGSNCDGEWEHAFGIKLITLDNPGWSLNIELFETRLENKSFPKYELHRTEDDWLMCRVENEKFLGACGVNQLSEMIELFLDWAEA